MEEIRKDGSFDENEPGRHINSWDFNRLSKISKEIGFQTQLKVNFGAPLIKKCKVKIWI